MAGKRIEPLTVPEVQHVAHALAKQWMDGDEPIPPFEQRQTQVLESCIEQPFLELARKAVYRGLIGKAAMLFYLLIKNHPFVNGNKRIAITSLLCFLGKNDRWVKIRAKDFYDLAVWVAKSSAEDKDRVVNAIEGTLRKVVVSDKDFDNHIADPAAFLPPRISTPKSGPP